MMREIAAVERHALADLENGVNGGAEFNLDDARRPGAVEGLRNHRAELGVIRCDSRHRSYSLRPIELLGGFLQILYRRLDRALQPFDQFDWIGACVTQSEAVLHKG